jgi:hypothetical protein
MQSLVRRVPFPLHSYLSSSPRPSLSRRYKASRIYSGSSLLSPISFIYHYSLANMYSSDDELPQPPGSRSPSPPLPLNTAAFRKRSYGEASTASSDMPFFSSDDLADASIGNYTSPRHKKQYRRTWWESESSSAATRKEGIRRAAKRAKDSGVFMPSSDSSGPEEGFGYNQLKPVTPPKKESSTISPKRVAQSGARNFFRELVEECLEDNNETIDAQ